MSTEIVTELVHEKDQLQAANQQLLAIVGTLAAGKNGTNTEVRVSKAQLNKMVKKQVLIRGLKTGGAVVTIKDADV